MIPLVYRSPQPKRHVDRSCIFAGLTTVADRQRDRQTDRPRYSVVTVGHIYVRSTAMGPNIYGIPPTVLWQCRWPLSCHRLSIWPPLAASTYPSPDVTSDPCTHTWGSAIARGTARRPAICENLVKSAVAHCNHWQKQSVKLSFLSATVTVNCCKRCRAFSVIINVFSTLR